MRKRDVWIYIMCGPQILGFVTTLPYQWVQMQRERPYWLWYGMGRLLFDIYKYEHNVPQRNTDKSTYQKKKGTKINQRM